jgi:hypothetical protein
MVSGRRRGGAALMTLASLVVGLVTALLGRAVGQDPYPAALTGGGAFGATLLLLIAVFRYATDS